MNSAILWLCGTVWSLDSTPPLSIGIPRCWHHFIKSKLLKAVFLSNFKELFPTVGFHWMGCFSPEATLFPTFFFYSLHQSFPMFHKMEAVVDIFPFWEPIHHFSKGVFQFLELLLNHPPSFWKLQERVEHQLTQEVFKKTTSLFLSWFNINIGTSVQSF